MKMDKNKMDKRLTHSLGEENVANMLLLIEWAANVDASQGCDLLQLPCATPEVCLLQNVLLHFLPSRVLKGPVSSHYKGGEAVFSMSGRRKGRKKMGGYTPCTHIHSQSGFVNKRMEKVQNQQEAGCHVIKPVKLHIPVFDHLIYVIDKHLLAL